jgi:hypothetical protein
MANRQSECIKVRKSAFSIRLDFFASFFVKKKRREKIVNGKRCKRKINGKRWEAASMAKGADCKLECRQFTKR